MLTLDNTSLVKGMYERCNKNVHLGQLSYATTVH